MLNTIVIGRYPYMSSLVILVTFIRRPAFHIPFSPQESVWTNLPSSMLIKPAFLLLDFGINVITKPVPATKNSHGARPGMVCYLLLIEHICHSALAWEYLSSTAVQTASKNKRIIWRIECFSFACL